MNKQKQSSDFEFDTLDYYRLRMSELEQERDREGKEAKYYQTELAKSHEILGRVIHQLSERWDTVKLTKYYPTDNLWCRRSIRNPEGKINN